MALTMMVRQATLKELALSYRKGRKKDKSQMLDYLVECGGYNRSYAARALRKEAKVLALKNRRKGIFPEEKKGKE